MAHDIIDNREARLIDELAARFPSSERARFAVGYFFLSGLEPLRDQLYNLRELGLMGCSSYRSLPSCTRATTWTISAQHLATTMT